MKRTKSHKNVKRQPGSLQVWQNEATGYVWESVVIHHGRTTHKINGPEGISLDLAHQFFTRALKE